MKLVLRTLAASFFLFGANLATAAACDATAISPNQTLEGTLSDTDCRVGEILNSSDNSRVDVFELTLGTSGDVAITLSSTEFDPFLRLLASDLSPIAEDDDSGAGFNAAISTTLDAGQYTILANSATSTTETGSYTLTTSGPTTGPTTPGPTEQASRLINIATRAFVDRGDGVTIGGLIIEGTEPKTVVIRALGPELANRGVNGVLTDPQLQLFSGPDLIDSNDDWDQHARKDDIPSHLVPGFQLEPVIVATLEPGAYTAIVRGNSETTGVGLVEIFEATQDGSVLVNIATRGTVGLGDNVLIGGLVISGDQPKKVLIRAKGPSLSDFGVKNALSDPSLQLFSGADLLDTNDNWQSHSNAGNIPTELQPTHAAEASILVTLQPGAYTAIVRGVGETTGIGLVEVFAVQ